MKGLEPAPGIATRHARRQAEHGSDTEMRRLAISFATQLDEAHWTIDAIQALNKDAHVHTGAWIREWKRGAWKPARCTDHNDDIAGTIEEIHEAGIVRIHHGEDGDVLVHIQDVTV